MIAGKERLDRGVLLLPGEERRRSQRVIIRVPLTLEMTKSGQVVKMTAQTVAVNVHGAMVLCSRPLDSGTEIEIINDRTHERAGARVMRASRESSEGYLIPLGFDKPFPTFWQISFPPSDWKPSDV